MNIEKTKKDLTVLAVYQVIIGIMILGGAVHLRSKLYIPAAGDPITRGMYDTLIHAEIILLQTLLPLVALQAFVCAFMIARCRRLLRDR